MVIPGLTCVNITSPIVLMNSRYRERYGLIKFSVPHSSVFTGLRYRTVGHQIGVVPNMFRVIASRVTTRLGVQQKCQHAIFRWRGDLPTAAGKTS